MGVTHATAKRAAREVKRLEKAPRREAASLERLGV
jgi:hypothetical protein